MTVDYGLENEEREDRQKDLFTRIFLRTVESHLLTRVHGAQVATA